MIANAPDTAKDRLERHVEVTRSAATATTLLAEATGLSKQRIKQAMHKGAVWVTHGGHTRRLRRMTKLMNTGDQLHLYYDEKILFEPVSPAKLVSDEDGYSVWYKPYGMLAQGSKWGDHTTIVRWAEQNLKPERSAFVVHRLDRAATGLIVVAHRKGIAAALSKMFHDRTVVKKYLAIVAGEFPHRDEALTIDSDLDARSARTLARLMDYDAVKNHSLLDVQIETGRKHQIRRHLADVGFPIVGDRMYGPRGDECDLQLTACYLSFTCPMSGLVKEYELPASLCSVL